MREIGELLESHVRREERELFPLIERLAAGRLESSGRSVAGGPVWGQASDDLNATLLAWSASDGPAEHVNDGRDVLVFLVHGAATITIDDEVRDLGPGDAVIVAKGRDGARSPRGAAASAISPSICAGPPMQVRTRAKDADT